MSCRTYPTSQSRRVKPDLARESRPQYQDPSTYPAGLFPFHSLKKPDLARGNRPQYLTLRPQHTSCRTIPSSWPRYVKADLAREGRPQYQDTSTHPAGPSPLHSPDKPDLARKSRPQQYPSTRPAGLSPLRGPDM